MLSTIEELRETCKSPEYRKRTAQALTETCQMLAKEMRYPEDLRKPERVAFLEGHIKKLEAVLV